MTIGRGRRRRIGATLAGAFALLAPAPIWAQAFLQWDQPARVLGMGGAASGLSDEPTSAFFGPAGIVRLAGTQVHVGGILGARTGSFHGYDAPDADADFGFAATPTIYVTHAIAQGVSGGLSVSTPWRSDLAWEDAERFAGRFRATELGLRGVLVNPVVAFELAPGWSGAVGIAIADVGLDLSRFEQEPALSALGGAGPIALAHGEYDLGGNGAGWVLAGSWRPREDLAGGLQLRGAMEVDLSGHVDFTIVAPAELRDRIGADGRPIGERIEARYVDQSARSRLELPAIVVGGVSWSPIPPIVLAADLQWVGWSALEELPLAVADTTRSDRTALDYDDAWALRLGAEARPAGAVRVRVGYAREWSPAPLRGVTPLLPDADRNAVSLGAGFQWMGNEIDIAYRLAVLEDREGVAFPDNTTAADGRFEAVEHRLGIGVTRRF